MRIGRFIVYSVLSMAVVACNASPGLTRAKPGEVGGPPINLALGGVATQSSTDFGGNPARAIDGNTDGRYFYESVTHTENQQQPWWQVDLGGSKELGEISVWNRIDCCSERLSDWYVLTSDAPFTNDLSQALSTSGVSSVHVTHEAESPSSVILPAGTTGRYARVWSNASGFLSLAEVEVFGTSVSPPSPPPASHLPAHLPLALHRPHQ